MSAAAVINDLRSRPTVALGSLSAESANCQADGGFTVWRTTMNHSECSGRPHRKPWNKGKLVGQKPLLRLKEIWAIRIRLQLAERVRELALFNLPVDSKLRSCDLMKLRVKDVTRGHRVGARAIVVQQKTERPVQFEITEQTRESVAAWISHARRRPEDFLFPSRPRESPHLSTRQYAQIVHGWVREIGLNPAAYGTHTLRCTKAALIYRRTKNLRAVQLLLGHSKLESTVRYLGMRSTTPLRWPGRRKCRSGCRWAADHSVAHRTLLPGHSAENVVQS